VHNILTQSSLSTPVLWRLGSDADIQRIVANAEPAEQAQPAMQYQLGIRFVAERNFAAAVEPLSRAEQLPQLRDPAFRMRIYALCMSGQTRLAQRLAHERLTNFLSSKGMSPGSMKESDLPAFWLWMKKTFEIDPRVANLASGPLIQNRVPDLKKARHPS